MVQCAQKDSIECRRVGSYGNLELSCNLTVACYVQKVITYMHFTDLILLLILDLFEIYWDYKYKQT